MPSTTLMLYTFLIMDIIWDNTEYRAKSIKHLTLIFAFLIVCFVLCHAVQWIVMQCLDIRGPGIQPKSMTDIVVGNVDVMPTVLDLAGIEIPDSVDGKSFKSQILDSDTSMDANNSVAVGWRDVFLVEFLSPFQQYFNRCTTWYPKANDFHGELVNPSPFTTDNALVWVNFGKQHNPGNNYREIRIVNASHNWAYTEYINWTFTQMDKENPWLNVLFDLNSDPYELENIYDQIDENMKSELHTMLMDYGNCQGATCP